ncbi:merozoite surface protein 5 [Plasmodium cynomolgi strain B]|uniref:Merozoite surface protein 5 n=1 Tax=Plasmodium cynomolgi (strain B) TaxID=1120755 RepID=K6UCK9_PLACD|nr:merozoite surface protein 5 [Plasmodium cynomolgi strain B]GAB65031.1 merozoite surface protein 5 [Plasmodium cynomolgi strain B]
MAIARIVLAIHLFLLCSFHSGRPLEVSLWRKENAHLGTQTNRLLREEGKNGQVDQVKLPPISGTEGRKEIGTNSKLQLRGEGDEQDSQSAETPKSEEAGKEDAEKDAEKVEKNVNQAENDNPTSTDAERAKVEEGQVPKGEQMKTLSNENDQKDEGKTNEDKEEKKEDNKGDGEKGEKESEDKSGDKGEGEPKEGEGTEEKNNLESKNAEADVAEHKQDDANSKGDNNSPDGEKPKAGSTDNPKEGSTGDPKEGSTGDPKEGSTGDPKEGSTGDPKEGNPGNPNKENAKDGDDDGNKLHLDKLDDKVPHYSALRNNRIDKGVTDTMVLNYIIGDNTKSCSVNNGGCADDQICIRIDNIGIKCICKEGHLFGNKCILTKSFAISSFFSAGLSVLLALLWMF